MNKLTGCAFEGIWTGFSKLLLGKYRNAYSVTSCIEFGGYLTFGLSIGQQ